MFCQLSQIFIKSGNIKVSLLAEGPLSMFHLLGLTMSQALVSFIVFNFILSRYAYILCQYLTKQMIKKLFGIFT